MATKNDEDDIAGYLTEMANVQGVGCATTADGHVLVFKREALEALLEKSKKTGHVTVFIKRTDMQSS